jgi:peptidoglycan hydrolase-like protein with peptidoglycan-binding domain
VGSGIRRKLGTEVRAYVGALPLAATLLALAIPTSTAASAEAATLPTASDPPLSSQLAAPQALPGLLPGSGYQPGGSHAVRNLQRLLQRSGYSPGPIDGRYGPLTAAATQRFQLEHGLQADGIAGRQTLAALRAPGLVLLPGAGTEQGGSQLVRDLQRLLKRAGYAPGPIDGIYGARTEGAVSRYEASRGLPVNGIVAGRTFVDLRTGAGPLSGTTRPWPAYGASDRAVPRPPALAPAPASLPRANHPAGFPATSPSGSPPVGAIVLFVLAGLALLMNATAFASGRRNRPHAARRHATRREAASTAVNSANGASAEPHATAEALSGRNGSNSSRNGVHASKNVGAGQVDPDTAFNLGVLLEEQGDLPAAEEAYRRADDRGHAAAASNLGVLLEGRGDLARAEAAYRRADQRGEANGAFNLGVLLEEHHDFDGAEAAYRRADERGHAAAASNLGVLLEAQGDRIGAEAAYRRADQRGEANGAFNLAVLLEEQGDLAGAEPAYRRADQTGEAKVAQLARAALLDLGSGAQLAGIAHDGNGDGP